MLDREIYRVDLSSYNCRFFPIELVQNNFFNFFGEREGCVRIRYHTLSLLWSIWGYCTVSFSFQKQNKQNDKPTNWSNRKFNWSVNWIVNKSCELHIPPFGLVDPAGPGLGWAPLQIKFYQANPPRGVTFVCWPLQNYQCKSPIWWSGPSRGATFVCWPPPNSVPFRVFQTGSLWGVPPGANIWGRPLAWCRARVKWGAHAKFRGDGLCGSGGRLLDIHTHTHTHFHLYIRDMVINFEMSKRWTKTFVNAHRNSDFLFTVKAIFSKHTFIKKKKLAVVPGISRDF